MSGSPSSPNSLSSLISQCMRRDQHRFRQRVRRLHRESGESRDKKFNALKTEVEASILQRQRRVKLCPAQSYDDALPISQRRDEIAAAIRDHQVVIVAGETGSGKTTQLPKICLGLGRGIAGFIGHTQPRRLAARSVATRIAEELNTPLGEAVGFKVRFSDHTKPSSYIKLMTDGILLAELQGDRFLDEYDTLIIDEAHERSLNIDFLLGYLKQLLPKRKDLKVIITSATIDTKRFSEHFNNAPVVEVSGRSYPVEIRYHDDEDQESDLTTSILSAVDELAQVERHKQGDILIFLSGEREIRETAEVLRKHHPQNTEILPLYSRLSANEQNRVFHPSGKRRIVLATNVAETSITVPGIRYVIDPGKARISRYSYRSKVQRLPIEDVAQSSANQRAGRCGRLSDGICIRLYSEESFQARPLFTEPEIQRTSLAAVILQMRQLGLGDPASFPFIDPPDQRFINDGYRLLRELNAVDDKQSLTGVGKRLARLPIDPKFARMVLSAEENNCLAEVLIIVSALSIQDPRERPAEKQQQADEKHKRLRDEDSDFISLLNLWGEYNEYKKHNSQNKLRKYCKNEFLSYMRMREWQETFQQLRTLCKGMGMKPNSTPAEYAAIHQSLLTGLLGNIGVKDVEPENVPKGKGEKKVRRYLGARNSKFHIFPGSGLAKKAPQWIMSAELVETSRLYARQNARIEPEWVEAAAQHLVKRNYSEPHWNPKRGIVMADETVSLYGLLVHASRRVNYGPVDPHVAREIFIREALVEGRYRTKASFFAHNEKLIDEARSLESKTRRQDVLVDDEVLFQFFNEKIPTTVRDHASFEKWRKKAEAKEANLLKLTRADVFRDSATSADAQYPGEMSIGGVTLKLKYSFNPGSDEDGMTAVIPVAMINQFTSSQFDCLVPGFFAEKVAAMLKGLAKPLRKQLVPIPETVDSVLENLDSLQASVEKGTPLQDCLSSVIKKEKSVVISAHDWRMDQLSPHFMMRFEVVDQKQKTLGVGRSLTELQSRFGGQAAEVIAEVPTQHAWQAEGLTSWEMGDLPESIMIESKGQQYRAYPALVDKGQSVGVELFDASTIADQVHQKGLRRLAVLENAKTVKHLIKQVPKLKEICLIYSQIASCDDLKNDLLALTLDQCFFAQGYAVRSQNEFSFRLKQANQLQPTANKVSQLVARILEVYQVVRKQFQSAQSKCSTANKNDIQLQLDNLVYPGFIVDTPFQWLQEVPRYLKALSVRLEKLSAAPSTDENKQQLLQPFLQTYEQLVTSGKGQDKSAELTKLRWMLEEYRVSLFAQPMKTSMPVSEKRLQKQVALCS